MKVFFQSVGLVITVILFMLLTVLTLYVSYILTIGIAIGIAIYLLYRSLTALKKTT